MSREPLTTRQQAVYDFIRNWCDVHGYPPTLREIASNIGVRSTNSVYNHLKILERKGYLTREDMKSRTWRPVDAPASTISDVPVVGSIAAGSPILALEDIQETISIDRSLVSTEDAFALRVRGDSMIEAGILDGDFLFVRPGTDVRPGSIVVALLGDEATVKYYHPEKGYIRLQPAHPSMAPLYVRKGDRKSFSLVGQVVGVFRKIP
jgi:repressor LexA